MNYNGHPVKIFFSYYKPHVHLFIADMICATFISLVDITFPMLSRFALNTLIPQKNLREFLAVVIFMFAAYLIRYACNWFVNYWGHVFGVRVEADMRNDVFSHLENQSFSFFDSNRTGKLMSRATTDLFEITELAHHGPEDLWISILTLCGSFVFLLNIRWELAVIVFVFLPVTLTLTILSRKKLSVTSKKVKEKTSELNAVLESSISGIRVTQEFTNEDFERQRMRKINDEFSVTKKIRFKKIANFHANIEFFNHLLSLLVLIAGGFFIMKGKMEIADLVAANLFIAAFTQPIRKLTNFVEQYTTGMAGFTRFLELMRTDFSVKDDKNAVSISAGQVKGNIRFENVGFSYVKDFPVLENVNLDISAGQKFALVGTSGGGKTTICSLLSRFYEATEGKITLDGMDIRKIQLKSLRSQIGTVSQDVFLFAGTIRENIAYGKLDATDEQIMEAARQAEIHEDILKLPEGYDTIVGERGIKLSGGQKQRISIARCFLKNPPILVLDEATSALDTATEIKIQAAFDKLSAGRTTIVIAHRLSTIKNADRIAVVGEKGILETGTHSQLMEIKGEYYRLQHIQNG